MKKNIDDETTEILPADDKRPAVKRGAAEPPRRAGDNFAFAFLVAALGFLLVFGAGTLLDLWRTGHSESLFTLLTARGEGHGDSLLYLAQIVAAILGIALTVVAIVVQLAANRYTPKVIDLFIRDPVNVPTLALFVVTALEAIWVAHLFSPAGVSPAEAFVPRIGVLITLLLTTVSLLVLVPYFRHTFRFLEPKNVIQRIRDEVIETIDAVDGTTSNAGCESAQARAIESLDHLFDIARNSVHGFDRTLALAAIFSMRDIALEASKRRADLPQAWFTIYFDTRQNPEFLSFPQRAIDDFEREGTWLERKIAWQLHRVYVASLNSLRALAGMLALVVRELGEDAIARKNIFDVRLAMRTFNSFLRAALNARDVRTSFNVLQQYRLFVERLAANGDEGMTLEALEHFRYYGHVADRMGLGFVLETAAHDIGLVIRSAHESGVRAASLDVYISVLLATDDDEEGSPPLSTVTRRGVRRSQAVLAIGLLARKAEGLAQRIADDMRGETPALLRAVKAEIFSAEREFFELTERVSSFGYVTPEERPFIETFFGWLDPTRGAGAMPLRVAVTAPRAAARVDSPSSSTIQTPPSLLPPPTAPPPLGPPPLRPPPLARA